MTELLNLLKLVVDIMGIIALAFVCWYVYCLPDHCEHEWQLYREYHHKKHDLAADPYAVDIVYHCSICGEPKKIRIE